MNRATQPGDAESRAARLEKELRHARQLLERFRERATRLENVLELVCSDDQVRWLYRNRTERMDATVPIFPEARARFHLARYEFAAQFVKGLSVADIACGTGYGCRVLLDSGGAASVTGVDIDPETIEYARRRHGAERIRFLAASAGHTALPDGELDCVVSFETIEHVPDDGALLDEFARILKPGGLLICSTPNQWPLEIAPHHVRVYDRESFLAALEKRFAPEKLFNQNSGSDFRYNHDQPAGIVPTTDGNAELAECFIVIARSRGERSADARI